MIFLKVYVVSIIVNCVKGILSQFITKMERKQLSSMTLIKG